MASGDTKTEAMLNVLGNGGSGDEFRGCCNTKTQQYILDAIDRVQSVENEVEEIKNNPDVADIVATYSDLQAYDKSKLTDKDVIRVLADETHNGDSTYYRYSKSSNDFTYIGESKQYVNFVGTDGTAAGVAGLVPAPATTDAGKFLKADGTWDTAGGGSGPTVVQTVGTSITDVMSQNAVSSMVFADPATQEKIKIGAGTSTSEGSDGIEIGHLATATGINTVAIGRNAQANNNIGVVALGANSAAFGQGSIALGAASGSNNSTQGVMYINATNTAYGYNSSNYRLLTGLYDGQGAHDAVTLGQLNGRVKTNAGAPTTSTAGTVGQLLEDTTNAKLYQCTAVDTTDPQNPSYTWTEVGAGGGGGGDTVYSDKTTSTSASGGAVYIGNLNSSQVEQSDPTTTDNHYKYFWALPNTNSNVPANYSVNIMGRAASSTASHFVVIGEDAAVDGSYAVSGVAIGQVSYAVGNRAVALGGNTNCANAYSVALGGYATTSRVGEVNVGTGSNNYGYNSTKYRVIGGVHDGQLAQDAVTVNQVNSVIDAINTALSTNIPHIGA